MLPPDQKERRPHGGMSPNRSICEVGRVGGEQGQVFSAGGGHCSYGVSRLMLGSGILISPECLEVDAGSVGGR